MSEFYKAALSSFIAWVLDGARCGHLEFTHEEAAAVDDAYANAEHFGGLMSSNMRMAAKILEYGIVSSKFEAKVWDHIFGILYRERLDRVRECILSANFAGITTSTKVVQSFLNAFGEEHIKEEYCVYPCPLKGDNICDPKSIALIRIKDNLFANIYNNIGFSECARGGARLRVFDAMVFILEHSDEANIYSRLSFFVPIYVWYCGGVNSECWRNDLAEFLKIIEKRYPTDRGDLIREQLPQPMLYLRA